MDQISSLIALSFGAAWASGINLYAAMAMLGVLGYSGAYDLPPGLEVLQNPVVIGISGLLYVAEFFADKIPGVDTGWDTVHSFVRIPAAITLAALAMSPADTGTQVAVAVAGGGLGAAAHFMKAGTRVFINTSPEPLSNWGASVAEDVFVVFLIWLALTYPYVTLGVIAVLVLLAIWLIPKLWRGIRRLFSVFKGGGATEEPSLRSLFRPGTIDLDDQNSGSPPENRIAPR